MVGATAEVRSSCLLSMCCKNDDPTTAVHAIIFVFSGYLANLCHVRSGIIYTLFRRVRDQAKIFGLGEGDRGRRHDIGFFDS